MILDIINPSDACHMVTDDREAAAIACILIGNGQYGLEQVDAKAGETPFKMPLFLLGGHDQWWTKTFGHSFEEGATAYRDDTRKNLALINALLSVVYGKRADLESYYDAMELITQTDGRAEFKRRWNDRRRGSMNNIGGRALALAEAMGSDIKKAQEPT
jgi:hypothetical protein